MSKIIDIAKLKTQQSKLPRLDKSKYKKRAGLEGPFMTKAGQVVYYDKKKGQYYNPDNDMYLSYNDWKKLSESNINELSVTSAKSIKDNEVYQLGLHKGSLMTSVAQTSMHKGKEIKKKLPQLFKKYKHITITSKSDLISMAVATPKNPYKGTGAQILRNEDAPANATGTAVVGTGDDSSTVVVKKKKPLQAKLMRRLKIKETIDRVVPDLEYPKDEITERKQQLIDLAKKYGENI